MLILTRKIGQAFSIGNEIKVIVTEISGDKVKIGIEAPRELKVLRDELGQTMEYNQQALAGTAKSTLRELSKNLKQESERVGLDNRMSNE